MNKSQNYTIIELETIDSTNTYAKQLLETSKVADKTIIWAKNQTQGRGQQGNKWECEPEKNLTFSIILFPHFIPPENQYLLNKAIALAVYHLVCNQISSTQPVKIKWPNDIYINKKKVAGILIENTISGSLWNTSIIGIGININQKNFPDTLPNPVSLINTTGKTVDIKNVLEEFIVIFNEFYTILKTNAFDNLNKQYLEALYQYQENQKYKIKNSVVEAKIIDISAYGRLVLLTSNNERLECDFKEVVYL